MIDVHAHLTDERFARDLDAVLDRAAAAGVERILTCGEDVASSDRAVALARRSPLVRVAVGIHPHRASACDEPAIERIRTISSDERVVAIGEIGIDLSGRSAPRADQERAFVAQIALAHEIGLPVCIHVRESGAHVRSLLDDLPRVRGHVHCYSEGPEDVTEWVERGLLVSFAGTVTFPRSERLRAAARTVPSDRLLLETDAPALAPQPQRGRRNEPAFVAATYACVADVRGTSVPELARQVRENAASLFGGRW